METIITHLEIQARRVQEAPGNKVERAHFLGMLEVAALTGVDVSQFNWVYLL